MPVTGRKPKPDDQKRNRVKPVHDWTEIEDVPFTDAPALTGRWSKAALAWWGDVSTMPHCRLWEPSDWRFALETLKLVAAFHRGNLKLAAEIRQREKLMGTTLDARRDLRIRYVPVSEPHDEEEEAAGVTSLADYRASIAE